MGPTLRARAVGRMSAERPFDVSRVLGALRPSGVPLYPRSDEWEMVCTSPPLQ